MACISMMGHANLIITSLGACDMNFLQQVNHYVLIVRALLRPQLRRCLKRKYP